MGVDQRGVFKMLGPHAHDHVGDPGVAGQHIAGRVTEQYLTHRHPQPGLGQRGREKVHGRRADEAGDKQIGGMVVELIGCTDLLGFAGPQHHDPVTECHRFGLIVSDIHRRGAEPVLQSGDLAAHLHPQFGVEVAERLIHQEGLGLAHDRATHRHPLALSTGQLGGFAVQKFGEIEDFGGVLDLRVDFGAAQLGQGQREGDVLPHRHVRVERVGLKHHGDIAVARCFLVDPLSTDAEFTFSDVFEPGDHIQRGRLTAP